MDNTLPIILITLIFSAFFSGLEIAFISANKLRIELKRKQGAYWAKICSGYFKNPSRFISTTLVGNNIALVVYGIYSERFLKGMADTYNFFGISIPSEGAGSLILFTLISTMVVLFLAEYFPKALFRINPTGILKVLIFPFQVVQYFLYPLVQFTNFISRFFLKLFFKHKAGENEVVFSRVDLDHFISETNAQNENREHEVDTEILKNAIDFAEVKLRDCLVPRTGVVGIEINSSIADLTKVVIESQHSKILVYQDSIDNIIGYVHQNDLFRRPKTIKSILIPILIATESKLASEMLNEFVVQSKSIALVVDEFGGTSGIVTAEDIIEEIFGEIEDEHDEDKDVVEKRIEENVYEFSSKLEVDYLNQKYPFIIPEGDYETLGGFIIANHESIPQEGDTMEIGDFKFTILSAEDTRIETVRLVFSEDV